MDSCLAFRFIAALAVAAAVFVVLGSEWNGPQPTIGRIVQSSDAGHGAGDRI